MTTMRRRNIFVLMNVLLLWSLATVAWGIDPCDRVGLLRAQAERSYAEIAGDIGLEYTDLASPGISRQQSNDVVVYTDATGKNLSSVAEIERLNALKVPPAWKDVWIAPKAESHVLATGTDSKGRRQYLYHPRWRVARDLYKFQKVAVIGAILPTMRTELNKALSVKELNEGRVLAAIVTIISLSGIRVGNERYAAENDTYGVTTLQKAHIEKSGNGYVLKFNGKHDVSQEILITDQQVSATIKQLLQQPGDALFRYQSSGKWVDVTAPKVNEYISSVTQGPFTAKDFRTWIGNITAVGELIKLGSAKTPAEVEANIKKAIASVAEQLGNTPTVARDSYISPLVLDSYRNGQLIRLHKKIVKKIGDPQKALETLTIDLLSTTAS